MTNAQLVGGLFGSLGATVVALGAALLFAHKHDVKKHIIGVCVFVALLLVTIVFAELVGKRYTFASTPKTIHLALAFSATVALLAPLFTGVQHWRGQLSRGAHVVAARVFLVLTVAAIGTGLWMLSTATTPVVAPG
jgi:hypothetical protein